MGLDNAGSGRTRHAAGLGALRHDPHRHQPSAFDAIAANLPLGGVSFENKTDERGERLIWLDHAVANKLRAMRGHGESFSDAILRLVEADAHAPVMARK